MKIALRSYRVADRKFRCGLEAALKVVGGKWKVLILWHLENPTRFGELKRFVSGISEKVLIQQLRELEADGIVTRKDFREVPQELSIH